MEWLEFFGKIISKLTLSFTYSAKGRESSKGNKMQDINVYVHNVSKKIEKIEILSDINNIYANELITEIVVKAEFVDGTPASFSEVEFRIENEYGPIIKNTDKDGKVSFCNVQIKRAGNHRLFINDKAGFVYQIPIIVKDNPINLKFISQPQDVASKEVLNEVVVQAAYQSGTIAENVLIKLDINKDGVSWIGTREKNTNKEGIVSFDNIIFTKTGNYKLKAMCQHTFSYSTPFHVFAPGVCIDFEKYAPGSKEEVETFLTALLEKQSENDLIKYNGEEY